MTPQRMVLLDIIQSAEGHLDAATLLRLAREQDVSIDRATVYRTLELLKKLRLVDELDLMHLNGEKHFYEVTRGRGHIHLACFVCRKIEEFSSPLFEQLQQELQQKRGVEVSVVRMEAGGRCRECSKNPN